MKVLRISLTSTLSRRSFASRVPRFARSSRIVHRSLVISPDCHQRFLIRALMSRRMPTSFVTDAASVASTGNEISTSEKMISQDLTLKMTAPAISCQLVRSRWYRRNGATLRNGSRCYGGRKGSRVKDSGPVRSTGFPAPTNHGRLPSSSEQVPGQGSRDRQRRHRGRACRHC